jgi:hypothetical protein
MRIKIDGTEYQVSESWREPLTLFVQRLNDLTVSDLYDGSQAAPMLHRSGPRRIAIIKEVRQATGMNLKDAKVLSDQAPVSLPVMTAEKAQAFVNAVNHQGGHATMPDPPVIDRLAAIAERVAQESPEADELYTKYMNAQELIHKILQAGELNSVFRDKIESYLSP